MSNRRMPIQKPGKSEQSVATPWNLIKAIEYRFGNLTWDLAASHSNTKCSKYITLEELGPDFQDYSKGVMPSMDSLTVDWHKLQGAFELRPLLWLNPEFGQISRWAQKCYEESLKGARIFLLAPLTCSKWHCDWIYGKAYILQLRERIRFESHPTVYPKDCQIAFFNSGIRGTEVWSWKQTLRKHEDTKPTV